VCVCGVCTPVIETNNLYIKDNCDKNI